VPPAAFQGQSALEGFLLAGFCLNKGVDTIDAGLPDANARNPYICEE